MKKRFIYFLCRIGLHKLARKLSPSLVWRYDFDQSMKKLSDAFKTFGDNARSAAQSIEQLKREVNKK